MIKISNDKVTFINSKEYSLIDLSFYTDSPPLYTVLYL